MEERATLLGGQFSLDSHPGRGTRVEVVIPYQDVEAAT
jgi:signal transduction histidine kinase